MTIPTHLPDAHHHGGSPGVARLMRRDGVALALLVLLLPAVHYVLTTAAGIELHFDEAQYWLWSRHLDWSYYSKGPLVAWCVALATALLGQEEPAVRSLAWLFHGLFLVTVFLFARDVWRDRAVAWRALFVTLSIPAFFVLGGVMTTDVILFTFWTLALWGFYRALTTARPRAWYAFGAAVGIGALAKLSIGLLPAAGAALMLLRRDWRRQFLSAPPWLAALLALVLMAPLWGWNAANDWAMFRHEQGHVIGRGATTGHLPEFLLGQALILSPLFASVLVLRAWRPPPGTVARRALWLTSLAVLGFFLAKAAVSKVQPNWPAPAYIGLLVVFAGTMAETAFWRVVGLVVVVAAWTQLLVMYFAPVFGVPVSHDAMAELRSWRAPLNRVAEQGDEADFLLAGSYRLASRLAYYWPRPQAVYLSADPERRLNQFDLWPGPEDRIGETALYVALRPDLPATLDAGFAACEALPPVEARRGDGQLLRTLYSWRCMDFQPRAWPRSQRY